MLLEARKRGAAAAHAAAVAALRPGELDAADEALAQRLLDAPDARRRDALLQALPFARQRRVLRRGHGRRACC